MIKHVVKSVVANVAISILSYAAIVAIFKRTSFGKN